MTLSKFDIGIIISMTIAVVFISFLFPAIGMSADNVNESDIPEYNITTDRFGGYLEKPEKPGAPNRGVLNHSSNEFDNYEGDIQVELGEQSSTGERIFLVAIETDEVHLVNASSPPQDNHIFTSNDETATISAYGYEVDVHSNNITYGEYEFEVKSRPGDSTWYNSLPLIGGIFSAGEQLAAIVGWIGSTFYYYLIQLGSGILNTLVIIYDLVVFFISLLHFLITTYTSIISSAPNGWVSLLVAIPGLLLSVEFAHIIYLVVRLIPTTG